MSFSSRLFPNISDESTKTHEIFRGADFATCADTRIWFLTCGCSALSFLTETTIDTSSRMLPTLSPALEQTRSPGPCGYCWDGHPRVRVYVGVSEFGGVEKAPLVCRSWIRSAEKERRSTARAASPPLPSRPWPAEAPRGRWRRRPTSFHGPQALTRQDTGGHGAYNGDYPPGP
jgi:hypothetical protein